MNPHTFTHQPYDDDIPWSQVPEKKITVEDVKYALSLHFQGTNYDPYKSYGDLSQKGMYRPIGINRNDFLSVIQLRNDGKAIDLLVVTHIDNDHIGGIIELLKENGSNENPHIIEIRNIWHNSCLLYTSPSPRDS